MDVFVDFENFLAKNLKIELFFRKIRSMISYLQETPLEIPYSSSAIFTLRKYYMQDSIHIVVQNEENLEMCANTIKELIEYGFDVKGYVLKKDLEKNIQKNKELEESFQKSAFLSGGNLFENYFLTRKCGEFCGIMNIFSIPLYYIFAKKVRFIVNSYFNGFISLFFRYIKIMSPIACIWPILIGARFLDLQSRMKVMFICTVFGISCAAILRTLLELQRERNFMKKGEKPLCGEPFLFGDADLLMAVLWFVVFAIVFIFFFFQNIFGGLASLIFSLAYFCTYMSKAFLGSVILIIISFFVQIICNPTFAYHLITGSL